MSRQTVIEILKIIAMVIMLVLLIYALIWLNSKRLDEKIETVIQTSIEGKSPVEENNKNEQLDSNTQNNQ